MKKNLAILFIIMIMGLLYAEDPVVENVRLEQRTDGSLKADIYYDVTDADGDTLTITLKASDDDGATWDLALNHVSGDVGDSVLTGADKHIVWDFLADYPDVSGEGYRIRVTASDYKEPRMVFIEGGTFDMGSSDGDGDESPVHTVTLSDFYMDPYEVTKVQYAEFLNATLAQGLVTVSGNSVKQDTTTLLDLSDEDCKIEYADGVFTVTDNKEEHPVTSVTWFGADAYAKYYAKRLPTEAEWEYAARGGSQSQGYTYSGGNEMNDVGWFRANSDNSLQAVGQKQANEVGLYDMSGNVWEWCADKYDRNYYEASPDNDPFGAGNSNNTSRILRGGAWDDAQVKAKPANRNRDQAWIGYKNRGFRCVMGDTNFTALNSITITPQNSTVANRELLNMKCIAQYSDGSSADASRSATWSIISGTCGSINNDGLFTAADNETGTVTVQAEFNGLSAETRVTVESRFETGTLTDIDGNVYTTIKIGDQWWMAENLNVTHYRNGDPILNLTKNADWYYANQGAYCYYNNDIYDSYGALYNWYVLVDNRNIAPAGWHVPSDEDWKKLEKYLGMDQYKLNDKEWRGTDEGGKLKESGTNHWQSPNTGATNESGFSALPGGYRYDTSGEFRSKGKSGYFWSSSNWDGNTPWYRGLGAEESRIYRNYFRKNYGFAIRLIRDDNITQATPVASFTVTPTSGPTGTIFNFDATGCKDSNDPSSELQVRWDWENDGTWDTDFSRSKTESHAYNSEGNKTIRMEVKNNSGLTSLALRQINVNQQFITITYPNGGESFKAQEVIIIRWNSNVSDERLDIDLYKGTEFIQRLKETGTTNDSDFNWAISSDLLTGSDYRIKITGRETGTFDFSDDYFTIINDGNNFETGTVTDIDGNVYQTIKIGDQWWMAENLNVTHYRNGDAIPYVTDNAEWSHLSGGGYCYYNNDSNMANDYGALYNWYAETDARGLAPEGWHVASDEDWKIMEAYLGGSSVAGGKLKEVGFDLWKTPNTGATNESGFGARPGGFRHPNSGIFYSISSYAYFWSVSENNSSWGRNIPYDQERVVLDFYSNLYGFSIRCVMD